MYTDPDGAAVIKNCEKVGNTVYIFGWWIGGVIWWKLYHGRQSFTFIFNISSSQRIKPICLYSTVVYV